jgi:hypothetical protein
METLLGCPTPSCISFSFINAILLRKKEEEEEEEGIIQF